MPMYGTLAGPGRGLLIRSSALVVVSFWSTLAPLRVARRGTRSNPMCSSANDRGRKPNVPPMPIAASSRS